MSDPASTFRLERVAKLRSDDPRVRVKALRALLAAPDPAPEIALVLEHLLGDATIEILSLPIRYGEIRLLAAEVLAATRAAAGQLDAVVVLDPGYPTLSATQIGERVEGTDCAAQGAIARYAWLRDRGALGRDRVELHPRAYL